MHLVRVSVRCLREALILFGHHLEPHAAARFEGELQRLGRVLCVFRRMPAGDSDANQPVISIEASP